jgi:hypothetical protein
MSELSTFPSIEHSISEIVERRQNHVVSGVPHDSLTDYIGELQAKLNRIYTLADEARGCVGQIDHTFGQAQQTNEDCELCQAKVALDEIRREANLSLRP